MLFAYERSEASIRFKNYRAPVGCNGEMSASRGAPTGSCFVLALANLLVKCTAVW
jgi:hypothetical protein